MGETPGTVWRADTWAAAWAAGAWADASPPPPPPPPSVARAGGGTGPVNPRALDPFGMAVVTGTNDLRKKSRGPK